MDKGLILSPKCSEIQLQRLCILISSLKEIFLELKKKNMDSFLMVPQDSAFTSVQAP